ncbi:MAG TPA: DUF4295 domain-containing protein [Bacteroidales bacterium]|nr:DUF4295 domain-containing protein [Bacteroidales bacterium]
MAKKVVATLKKESSGKDYVKVIKMVKSSKTGAYEFKENIITNELAKEFFEKKS